MNVLVTGGAGYIGSHTVKALKEAGHYVVVFDDLSTGHRESVAGVPFVQGDVTRREDLLDALKRYSIDAVMHFAAKSLVGESMQDPAKYYVNNVAGGVTLLEALREAGVGTIIFSSTAAVYGEPESIPIPEEHPLRPTSVYGRTKLMFEQMLEDYRRVYGLRYAALRYFNAAGADPSGQIGEDHDPETHLIPIVLQAALGQREAVTIFGTDYDTPDGTCIRDYIHVTDLADAHVLALEALKAGGPGGVYNLGNGNGFSVRQVIEAAERVVGAKIPVKEGDRRPGDPAVLVASSARAQRELGWKPRFTDLDEIVRTAWQWHRSHPQGYAGPS
ncbi:MAG TPA: UDP-glucose 4-epimerase GalE [Limnochordia bacterium]|nr:UDP-glucose 4-epimerase GalE [Limnochordia bacterium]